MSELTKEEQLIIENRMEMMRPLILELATTKTERDRYKEALERIGNEAGSPITSYEAECERQELAKSRFKISKIVQKALKGKEK